MSDETQATLFERIGGREAVARIVDTFYDRVERDPELRALFPENLGPGREKQRLFFEEWLGGEPRYSTAHGPPMMRRRHLPFTITERAADRWLAHFAAAIEQCAVPPDVAGPILERLRVFARHMVNTLDPTGDPKVGGSHECSTKP